VYVTTTKQLKNGYSVCWIVACTLHSIAVEQADDAHAAGGWPEMGVDYPEKFY